MMLLSRMIADSRPAQGHPGINHTRWAPDQLGGNAAYGPWQETEAALEAQSHGPGI